MYPSYKKQPQYNVPFLLKWRCFYSLNHWHNKVITVNTSLNKFRAWHIDGTTNKNPYDFYKVLTFKWYMSKIWTNRIISLQSGLMSRVFTNGPEDWGSITGRVIPKTQKMVLDATLLNTQHYKGKVEQSRERSTALPYTLV